MSGMPRARTAIPVGKGGEGGGGGEKQDRNRRRIARQAGAAGEVARQRGERDERRRAVEDDERRFIGEARQRRGRRHDEAGGERRRPGIIVLDRGEQRGVQLRPAAGLRQRRDGDGKLAIADEIGDHQVARGDDIDQRIGADRRARRDGGAIAAEFADAARRRSRQPEGDRAGQRERKEAASRLERAGVAGRERGGERDEAESGGDSRRTLRRRHRGEAGRGDGGDRAERRRRPARPAAPGVAPAAPRRDRTRGSPPAPGCGAKSSRERRVWRNRGRTWFLSLREEG